MHLLCDSVKDAVKEPMAGSHVPDPCMRRLRSVMAPACNSDLCGPECCASITLFANAEEGCSDRWREAYEARALSFRRKIFYTCNRRCETRSRCEWSDQFADSPCYASACADYFTTTVMTDECASAARKYCAAHERLKDMFADEGRCRAFLRTKSSSSRAVASLGFVALDASCDTFFDSYLQGPLLVPQTTARLCFDQIVDRCAAVHNCTCFVPDFSQTFENETIIVPCQFSNCALRAETDSVAIQRYVAAATFAFATIVLFVVKWCCVGGHPRAKGTVRKRLVAVL